MLPLILLLLINGHLTFTAPTENLTIRKGEEIQIISPNYPAVPPVGTNIKWNLNTEPNTNLLLQCKDLRISPSDDCKHGYFMVYDGKREDKFCGSESGLTIKSVGIEMRIEFDLNWSQGMAKCTVKTIAENEAKEMDDHNGEEIHLEVGKKSFDKIHYDRINKNEKKKWIFTTNPGAFISVHCGEMLLENDCDRVKVDLIDENGKETICNTQTDYEKVSSTNKLTFEIIPKDRPRIRFNCIVQAVTGKYALEYRNIISEEVDSSEYGKREGSRKTNCNCGWSAKSAARIVNGVEAEDGAYPWMVSLNKRGQHFCGGSIITESHVLSAAHCTVGTEANEWTVFVGTTNKTHTMNGQQIQVKEIIYNEYDGSNYNKNDIIILVLEEKIQFTNRIGPVCLTPDYLPLDHKTITAIGWGSLGKEGGWENPQQLMKAYLRVVDLHTCSYLWARLFELSNPSKLCTWATNRDICFGDSGGPLVWLDPETNRYTQIALVSFGRGCNTIYPTVNTNVAHYYQWIQEVIKRLNPELQTCEKI